MPIELQTTTHKTPSRAYGFDLAGLQGDGTARASDDGRRRVLACSPFPAGATPQVCVAAWHGVLHWLGYNDEPVTTCLAGQRAEAGWPIVTSAGAETSLAQLLADVDSQWLRPAGDWLDLRDPAHAELLACHTFWLEAGPTEAGPELALVRGGDSWQFSCAASRYSEAYQRLLMALWHQFVVALLERPRSLLSEQTCAGAGDTAGMVGPVVSIAGNLVERLAARMAATPDEPAVIDDRGSISFAGLDALSSAWAQALRAAGAKRGGYVGVAFRRGHAMVAAQYAVLKAGAAFVPMDASQPATRLQGMADDTDMRLVLGDAAAVSSLRTALPGVSCLVAEDLPATPDGSHDAVASLGTDDPAYVIFTSGSTGRPKGVKVSHGNLLNFVAQFSKWVGADDTTSQFAPFTFDASVAEIHSGLLNGTTVLILSSELIDDPDRLQAHMTEQGVSFASFPPQYAQHLSPAKLPRLKTLMTAGSAPDHALVARWQPHVRYLNAYGPTETTILSTAWQASHVPNSNEPICIGTPICNTEVRAVNRFNQPLPRGLIGELLIGGEGVTHGYLKRDELTRERFITLDRKRWYRSGDLAWFDGEGQLIFAGRVDNQVKLRGHRLEPGEVETALLAIDGIREAAVAAVDVAGAKQLVAFCAGAKQPEEELRERLGQLLPAWALPNRIVWLERLPLTPNGKTDYRGLVASLAQVDAPAGPADYADALEEELAAIWRSVLQQPRISREDSFIHLGGDSLTSLVVSSAVKRLGYETTSAQLLQHPRLADYARLLRAGGQRRIGRDYASCQGPAPLSPIQGWFFNLRLAHPGSFCQSLVFDSEERIDVERLAQACARLAGYHDELRACFVPDAQATAGWRQELLPESMALPAPEVLEAADSQLEAAGQDCCRRLAAELRIDAAPLFRLAVIHTPRRSRVLWVMHHLIVDTVSHGILLDDLHQLYCSANADVTQVLPGKSASYGGWAGRLQEWVAGHSGQLLEPWRPVLDAVTKAQALPLVRGLGVASPAVREVRLSQEETTRLLKDATSCYRQSPEELVLAATYRALARTFNLHRLAIDVEWHGRDEELAGPQGLDRSVGWFTSVHPLCMEVPLDQEPGPWLMALKEARAAIPHRGREFYALRYLSPDAEVRAAFEGYRQPEVLFNFSGVMQRSQAAWRSVPVAIELGDDNGAPYALSVESGILDGELAVGLYHDPAAWPEGTIARLGEAMVQCLGEVLAHCSEAGNRRWTPSDFAQLSLTQAQVDELPLAIKAAYPLTDMQQTMYRHKDTYQVVMCYRMPESFDEAPWSRAVADWLSRHDCLRTYFRELPDGGLYQVVLADLPVPATVLRVAAGEVRARADALVLEHRAREVTLDRAPLFDLSAIDSGGESFEIVLSIHHMIHDGWSVELLLNDLLQSYRYRRGLAGRAPAGPTATIADIVDAQQRLLADPAWRDYWHKLPWSGPAARLPAAARPRPSEDRAGRREVRLYAAPMEPVLANQVRAAARRLGVTVNSLWLAGFAMLLRYLGGDAQVRCGIIQSGRMEDIPGADTITGCCVNCLPLVLDIHPEDSVGGIVAEVASQLDRMRESAAFPLSHIYQDVKSRIKGELFHVMFNIEAHRYGADDGAARPELTGGYESTDSELVLSLIERQSAAARATDVNAPPEYEVRIGYDVSRYDAEAMREWVEIYAQCMRVAITQQDSSWRGLRLLPDAMAARAVQAWNDTARSYPEHRCVEELFRARAAAFPQAPALLYRDATWSYAELDAASDALAAELQRRGVGPETIVALLCDRSPEWVIAMLALFKAGGAFAAVNPRYPVERVRHILTDSAAALALVQKRALDPVLPPDLAIERLYLQEFLEARRAGPGAIAPRPVQRHPRQLAYVMYTSGSTGAPKGVMIEQRSIVRLVAGDTDIHFDPDDRILQTCAPGFDATTWEVWAALLNGLGLVLADEDTLLDPRALACEVESRRVTTLLLVTPVFNHLVQEVPSMFAGLRRVLVGGEALSPPHVQAARAVNPRLQVVNGYGPTENTTFSTFHFAGDSDRDVIPIGRPIANSTAYVFSADGQLLPPGVDGELWVGGAGVARGYLNQPELTSAQFVPDPFSGDPEARLYRTGDLVRWRRDGVIDFFGRIDHQVKIRGFRVELGEIENAIAAHPGVKQAAVLARQEGVQNHLVAYCTLKGTEVAHGTSGRVCALDAAEHAAVIGDIVESLRRSLPEYMVPAAFVILDAMPLTANGKVDRKALPAPDGSAYLRRAYEAPQGETETALAEIWAELLKLERIGRHDNFFELGGHSLSAVQLASRVRRKLEVELPMRAVFEAPVLRQMAEVIAGGATPARSDIRPAERRPYMPLSLAQQRLWFLTQIDGASAAYHIGGGLRLTGALDRDALERALRRVLERHEALRTRFAVIDGQPMQVISGEASLELSYRDLRGSAERERVRGDSWRALFERPFDLSRDLPLRAQMVRLEDDVHEMSVVMHHIVSDGWSVGVMLQELSRLYAAETEGRGDPLPPLPIQYADYACWQREWLAEGRLERQSTFWRETLSGAPALLELPADRPRPAQQDYSGTALDVRLDEALTSRLKDLSQRHGTTLYMTLLAGWAAVLGRLAGQEDVVIGSPVAGRNRAEIESLIGFFVNTLALRIDLTGDATVAELLSRTKHCVLEAQAHQDLPFDQVVEAVKPPRTARHSPIFQVMFAWQNQEAGQLSMPGVEARVIELPATTAPFDLSLSLGERDGGIAGDLNYATALFARGTLERYLGYWMRLLQAMTEVEDRSVASLPLLDAAERSRVLHEWNATDVDYPRDACAHQLFERQVERAPAAVAVTFEGQQLTYLELNRRANQLAHHLRTLGVGPEVRVALCVERSPELVIGMLGILKAGGAYVPLDPSYPRERLAFMLGDSAAPVLVTHRKSADTLPTLGEQRVYLDSEREELSGRPEGNPASGATADNLAYVIYTSGSTGRPKGTLLQHRGLCNTGLAAVKAHGFRSDSRILQFAASSFDASVCEVFSTLLAGGCLVLAPHERLLPNTPLRTLLEVERITAVTLTPSVLAQLESEGLPHLETIISAGEACAPELARRWTQGRTLLNAYGPTEVTVCASITPGSVSPDRLTIGRTWPNTRAYVLDAGLQPLPVGVAGELYIGGVGLARGYHRRPELTAEKFVPNPFSGVPGDRLYRTGDRARWLADGELEHLGRIDTQVKVRGFRIELGEIESRLVSCEGVREAVVLAREEVPGDKQLVAYYLGDAALPVERLRERIAEGLPGYMMPSAFVWMTQWPLSPSGKLDRKALPAPGADAYARRAYEAPQGDAETALAAIWEELLRIEHVGRHDNFFELGGHSLIAVTMIEQIRKQGLHSDVRALFMAPTLKEFAGSLRQQRSEVQAPPNRIPEGTERITPEMLPLVSLTQREIDAIAAQVPGGAANVQDIYPLSPLQEGMLFQRMLHSGGDAYHAAAIVSFAERSRVVAYLAALQTVVDRHDVLRTSFAWEGLSEPVQIVQRKAVFVHEELPADTSGGPVAARLVAAYDPAVFQVDLAAAPLLLCRWTVDPQAGRWLVCFVFHHLVIDHVTLETIMEEVALLEQGRAAELPKPAPYRNYIWRVRSGEDRPAQKAFFSRMLGDIDQPTVPFGLNAMNEAGGGFDEAEVRLPAELSAELRQRARELGVSAAALMHLAWALVLSRATGLERVVFGTVMFGRMDSGDGADRALGLFINTLPIRIDLGGAGIAEAVRKTHTELAELLSHEHASLAEAQRCSGVPAGVPLFTSLLNYRYTTHAPAVGDDMRVENAIGERTNYPLAIVIDDYGADFQIGVQTMPSVGARRICEFIQAALSAIAAALRAGPATPIAAVVLPAAISEHARPAAAERYWKAYLEGLELAASASLPLAPLGASDAASPQRDEQALETRALSIEATAQLARLARAEGVELGTLILAAWGLLLSKCNGEPEVLFGYATSESPAGLRIHPLPLRLKIDGDRTLGAWLEEIQHRQRDHEGHGHLALADIQRCSGARGGQALFESLVALGGVERNDFALTLAVHPGERLALELAYRTASFDAATIATLLRRLEQLLASFVNGGAQTLAQLTLLSEAERERALRQWNDTAVAYPSDRSVPSLFEEMARSRGAALALVHGEESWTYEKLDERVRVLSAWLARNGVSAGSRVALSLGREPSLVASMLAIMRCGAAYVPIALDCPPERRAFLLADAGIHHTLTRRSECSALADEELLCLEDCPAELEGAAVDVDPQSTAYVIYTSGTTGTPKGVSLSHRNLVNFCYWSIYADLFRLGDRITQFAPYTFDASAGEIFAALLTGAELHLLTDALIQDPRAVAQYLCAQDIRFSAFPPPYLQQMDPALVPAGLTLMTAGSAPTLELVRRWGARCRYVNGYGPTETTVLSSAWICERGGVEGRKLSIGRPICNTRMYVVDRLGQLCAPGLAGEIWIGGDGVAQGYLNQPELTGRQFLRDPWVDGGRVYRTGDYGRWLEDGSIEFVGRRDRQVKLRGFRIELNEIEKRARAHPQVRDAAVLVRGTGGEQRLLAWVVPAQAPAGEKELVDSIREFMRQSMPEYMLPQAIMPVAQLPLTAHGKLDEKALPEPAASAALGGEYVPPRTATEARLAAIWAAVLQLRVEQIGATSDFFALGGHSLLAMRAIARVRQELGADVDVAELFTHPVLADLAEAVDLAARSTLPPIVPIPRDGPLPLSYAQQRLWFLAQLEGVSAAYTIPGALRLSGQLDRAALRRALDRIVERHETLRTTFVTVGGEPRQRIHAATGFALREHDLRGLSDASEQLAHLMGEEAGARLDLATGPLIRGRLFRMHDDEHVLQITMHHIVFDIWSLTVMLRDLSALYKAYAAGAGDPLPALAVQYADYAAWQQQLLAGEIWQQQSDYWRRTLAGAPALLELPTDRPRPAQQDYTGDQVEFAFDGELIARLKALSQRHGTTPFMTLLAAWSVVLSRLSGQQDLVIGCPVVNRAQLETEPLIGFFVNSLAMRLDLSADPTLGELLQRVKHQVLDGQRNQQLPFEQVVAIADAPRTMAHTPMFQVMFSWQEQVGEFGLEGLRVTPLPPSTGLSKYDLTLHLREERDGMVGVFEYATALFDAATIQRQAGYLQRVVAAMVANADQRMHSLDLLGADEHALLQAFNDTAAPVPYETWIFDLFTAQVQRTPEAIAVGCQGEQLTYRELHARAVHLAAHVTALGAGPEDVVALLLPRGPGLVASVLGVWGAGAAYVALDPHHPPARLRQVLQQSGASRVVVDASLAGLLAEVLEGGLSERVRVLRLEDALCSAPEAVIKAFARPSPRNLVYIIFTSGSTGVPKGVMIEGRGMVNHLFTKSREVSLTSADVVAQNATQCFDVSVWQMLCPLLVGGRCEVFPDEVALDVARLIAETEARGVTILEVVPSQLRVMVELAERSGSRRVPLQKVRWVVSNAEALPAQLCRDWFAQYPAIPLINAYGPTECSDDVTHAALREAPQTLFTPVGRPGPNLQARVLDRHLGPAPVCVPGEIYFGGIGVGRGYLGRADLTAERFLPDPFSSTPGARMYRAGDLGRFLPDGALECLGRVDYGVKVRGFRIELGEVEAVLLTYPDVAEAAVLAREDSPGDVKLVAYFVAKSGTEPALGALREHLSSRLPDYMVPVLWMALDQMPLNANGKIDRKALPEPTAAILARSEYEAPRTDTERALAALWQDLLKVPQVGRGDNYFDLGGTSLLMIHMLSRLKDQGIGLSVTDMYQLRTVSACAAAIDAQRESATRWPLDGRWQHALVAVGGGASPQMALLLDRSERARHQEMRALLATVERAARPVFVRYSDDIVELSQQIAQAGVAALAPAHGDAALFDALRAQLREYQDRLAGAPMETSLRFSPIQRNFMTWQNRDVLGVVPLTGWHSAAELQQAFAAVAAEQDLLHAARDGAQPQWQLLAAGAIAAAPIPFMDLSGQDPARVDGLLQRLGAELLAAREEGKTPLAYVAAVVSLTDLEHLLLLAVDHLIWDAISTEVLQRRVQERLRGVVTRLARSYRDYVDGAWRIPEERVAALPRGTLDPSDLAATMDATRQALARRADKALQTVALRVPADAGRTAADQAFHCFKRCVGQITGLARYGIVLNHHGREFGAEHWFDQVGLFLDKIPFAADAGTSLKQLAGTAELLQRQGINYVGLTQVAGGEWGSTLPPMEYEVLFNFQAIAPEQSVPLDESHLMEKAKGLRGIVFEATAFADGLHVICAFRGEAGDAEAVRRSIAGGEPI